MLKVSLSTVHKVQFVLALTVAALGALYNNANSPNESPGSYVFTFFGSSPLV